MNRRLKSFFLVLILLTPVFLASCGQKVCVAGVGDCNFSNPKTGTTGTQVGGDVKFMFVDGKREVNQSETLALSVQNGPSDNNWKVEIVNGPGVRVDKTSSTGVSFVAASNLTADGFTRIRITDNNRYKNDTDTPLAFDEVMIKTLKRK